MQRLPIFALLPLLARGQTAQAECPCVSARAQLPQDSSGCLSVTCDSPLSNLTHSLGCVSADYGSDTCGAWDQSMPECQGSNPPSHCAQKWCYVDPTLCRSSSLRYQKSSYYPTISGLFYSYATCGGDHSAFESFERLQQASAQHQLTVVVPSVAYAPYHFKRDRPGGEPLTSSASYELSHYRDDSVPWEGLLIEYFAKLAASSYSGLSSPSWVLTWTSASSRAQHASSWTAAVNDVALGIADIGCSLFWMTAERLEMSSFTANLLSDQFYLFVPKPKVDDSLLTKIKQPFMPFTLGVWLVVILIILATGALQIWLTTRLWWDDWAARVNWPGFVNPGNLTPNPGMSRWKRGGLILSRLAEGWYTAYMSVVTGGPEMDENHRAATRLLNIGNGLFILLFLSAYTANLAAFIIKKDMVLSWADIDAATADGAKICVHTMLAPKMRTLYPDADFNARFMDVASDLSDGITVDGCDAFIMEIRAIKDPSIDQVRCDLGFVLTGTAVAELDVALPARPEVANLLTYWMKTLGAENGTTYSSIQAQMYGEPACPLMPSLSEEGDLEPMNLSNFAAPLFILAVFMGLAISTRLLRHASSHVADTLSEEGLEGLGAGGLRASFSCRLRRSSQSKVAPKVAPGAPAAADGKQDVQPSPLQTIEESVKTYKIITAQLELALQAEKDLKAKSM